MKVCFIFFILSSICFNVWAVALPEDNNASASSVPSQSCEIQLQDALKRIKELEKVAQENEINSETATAIAKIILNYINKKLGY